jgi:hypothetical protein
MASLEKGLGALRGCFPGAPIEVFIPPWNSFDVATMECLAALGFRVLCAGNSTRSTREAESFVAAQSGQPMPLAPGGEDRRLSFVPSVIETRALVDYLKGYSVEDLERVVGEAWLVVTMHGFDFDGSRSGCYVSQIELGQALAKIQKARADVGTIPIGAKPPLLNLRRECVLKGKVLLARRRRLRPFLPASGPDGTAPVLTHVGDRIAWLAWKLKMRLKPSR